VFDKEALNMGINLRRLSPDQKLINCLLLFKTMDICLDETQVRRKFRYKFKLNENLDSKNIIEIESFNLRFSPYKDLNRSQAYWKRLKLKGVVCSQPQ